MTSAAGAAPDRTERLRAGLESQQRGIKELNERVDAEEAARVEAEHRLEDAMRLRAPNCERSSTHSLSKGFVCRLGVIFLLLGVLLGAPEPGQLTMQSPSTVRPWSGA